MNGKGQIKIDVTRADDCRFTCNSCHLDQHGDYLLISVRDTGDGIKPEVLPHIFERFYSGDVDESRGFGLGLTIVQNIVQLHGGQIWAESEPNNGAIFRFTLPIAPKTLPKLHKSDIGA